MLRDYFIYLSKSLFRNLPRHFDICERNSMSIQKSDFFSSAEEISVTLKDGEVVTFEIKCLCQINESHSLGWAAGNILRLPPSAGDHWDQRQRNHLDWRLRPLPLNLKQQSDSPYFINYGGFACIAIWHQYYKITFLHPVY